MLSLSQFRSKLLPYFRLMSADGAYIDVSYKGRVYRVVVEDLKTDVPKRVLLKKRTLKDQIVERKCPSCRKLMLNEVCMNPDCRSHL